MSTAPLGPQFAMFAPQLRVQGLAEFQGCSLISTGFSVITTPYAFALAKGSPYRKVFNHHLIQMMEDGLMQKIINTYNKV